MTFGRISFKIEDIKGDWPTKEGRIRAVSGLDCGGVSGAQVLGLAKVKPHRMERLPDGRTLRVWVDGGYSIALLFDAGEVCLGVQDERMG